MNHKEKQYSYSLQQTLLLLVPALFAILLGCALLLYGLGQISMVLAESSDEHLPIGDAIGPIVVALIFLILGGTLLTLHTEVIITKSGARVRIFLFRWVCIPWDDMLDVTVTPLPGYNDPDLWSFIRVKRLSLFHRLASLFYCTGLRPVLIINKHINGYQELVGTIKNHIGQKSASP